MMKKFLPAIVLGTVLTILAVPFLVSAQTGPADCCQLRRTVTVEGKPIPAKTVIDSTGALGVCGTETGGSAPAADIKDTVARSWGVICLMNTLNTIVDWIFTILIIIAVVMVILGAISYLTSAGNPEKLQAGRNYIMYALIGVAIAFLARAIPAIFKAITGV